MADNIMGDGETTNLGVNVELGLDRSISGMDELVTRTHNLKGDISAAADEMSTFQEKADGTAATIKGLSEALTEAITQEKELYSIEQSRVSNLREMNNLAQEQANLYSRLSLTGNISSANTGNGSNVISNMSNNFGPATGYNTASIDPRNVSPTSPASMEPSGGGGGGTYGGGRGGGGGGGPRDYDPADFPEDDDEDPLGLDIPSTEATGKDRSSKIDNAIRTRLYRSGVGRYLTKLARNLPIADELNRSSIGNFAGRLAYGLSQAEKSRLAGNGFDFSMPGPNELTQPWSDPNVADTLAGVGVGGAMMATGTLAAKMIQMAYNTAVAPLQQAQQYTSETGGTGAIGALGYDLRAQALAGFGLNPLLSYGTAKQIELGALGQGYKGSLLNQAIGFGTMAAENYGISPQQSLQMFSQAVVQMGASASQLQSTFQGLARTASNTNTSFQGLLQAFQSNLALAYSTGMQGNAAMALSSAFSTEFANQPAIAGSSTAMDLMSSTVGQALVADRLGINYTQLSAYAGGYTGSGNAGTNAVNMAKATQQQIISLLNRFGLTRSSTDSQIAQQEYFIRTIAPEMGVSNIPSGATNFIKWVRDQFSFNPTTTIANQQIHSLGSTVPLSVSAGRAGASETLNQMLPLGGSPSQTSGALLNDMSAHSVSWNPNSPTVIEELMSGVSSRNKWSNGGFDVNGQFMSMSQYSGLSSQQQQMINALALTGKIGLANYTNGKMQALTGPNNTLLDQAGYSSLQASAFGNNQSIQSALQNIQLDFKDPKMKQIFTAWINNPGQTISQLLKGYQFSKGQAQ
jgi:hypothetical protein